MKNNELVTQWVIDTVKKEYPNDISLVVSHTTLRLDENEKTISFFVPITEKGRAFGRTFILQGEGFDIWGIDWERLENFAQLDEYNITVLADSEVLYSRNPEDERRFYALKIKLLENLSDVKKMRACALTAYTQAKNIYFEMLFAETESDIKFAAGYLIDYLAQAVAFTNQSYFRYSQTDQLNELKKMKKVPVGFSQLYNSIIFESNVEKQKNLCFEMINMVQLFLDENKICCDEKQFCTENNYQDLADWYAELSYTWLRIRKYGEVKDVTKTYMWGAMLQEELNRVCEDFGIHKFELMSKFNAENLSGFVEESNAIEKEVRELILEGGGIIKEFNSFEDFKNEV